jgi:hypothetical protein
VAGWGWWRWYSKRLKTVSCKLRVWHANTACAARPCVFI